MFDAKPLRPAWRQLPTMRARLALLSGLTVVTLCLYLYNFYHLTLTPDPSTLFRTSYPYSRTLVVPRVEGSSHAWIREQLADQLTPEAGLTVTFYTVDNASAAHHTPANKGNEAMAYLSYLIDYYDTFPDISIFIHGGELEWHNPRVLGQESAVFLRRLNLDKVAREGYVNLLCEWQSNCPAHIHPYTENPDPNTAEETLFVGVWPELFPGERAPQVLAQPCCSQFAVTREVLRRVPREAYKRLRSWLLNTGLSDGDSGRIFEYVWQYLFVGKPVFCPDPLECYCEMYGVCFDGSEEYEEFFALKRAKDCREQDLKQLDKWDEMADWALKEAEEMGMGELEEYMRQADEISRQDSWLPLNEERRPVKGLREKLSISLERDLAGIDALKQGALHYGSDPFFRMAAIQARRNVSEHLTDGVQCEREHDQWDWENIEVPPPSEETSETETPPEETKTESSPEATESETPS